MNAATVKRPAQDRAHKPPAGRIGPNAIIQVGRALRDGEHADLTETIYRRAGLFDALDNPPIDMVDEADAARLFRALFDVLPATVAGDVCAEAGTRTADYVLAHRIPKAAQTLLKALPSILAEPLLLKAIRQNAWTFAGSGQVSIGHGRPAWIEIAHNPIALPGCPWHRAVFERLFKTLVAPRVDVRHSKCRLAGSAICRFEIVR
ncbi:MAG: bacteriochlorophyll 4-vinyl reductase [Pseudomonadota bacterium]